MMGGHKAADGLAANQELTSAAEHAEVLHTWLDCSLAALERMLDTLLKGDEAVIALSGGDRQRLRHVSSRMARVAEVEAATFDYPWKPTLLDKGKEQLTAQSYVSEIEVANATIVSIKEAERGTVGHSSCRLHLGKNDGRDLMADDRHRFISIGALSNLEDMHQEDTQHIFRQAETRVSEHSGGTPERQSQGNDAVEVETVVSEMQLSRDTKEPQLQGKLGAKEDALVSEMQLENEGPQFQGNLPPALTAGRLGSINSDPRQLPGYVAELDSMDPRGRSCGSNGHDFHLPRSQQSITSQTTTGRKGGWDSESSTLSNAARAMTSERLAAKWLDSELQVDPGRISLQTQIGTMVRMPRSISHSFHRAPREQLHNFVEVATMMARFYTLLVSAPLVCFGRNPGYFASSLEVLCEVMFLMFVLTPFAVGMPKNAETDEWELSRWHIFKQYLMRWLVLDIASAFPWHLLWLLLGGWPRNHHLLYLSLLRLLQMPHLAFSVFFHDGPFFKCGGAVVQPNIVRATKLCCLFLVFVHIVACGYMVVARELATSGTGDEWTAYAAGTNFPTLYIQAYFWALMSILGENLGPRGVVETAYNVVVVLVGLFLNSCIIGSFASLLGSLDDRAATQKAKLDAVDAFMQRNGVQQDLWVQVRQYYLYCFATANYRPLVNSGSEDALFADLSPSLRLKLDLCIRKRFIQQCAIFSSCPTECVVKMVKIISSNNNIVVPAELIFKKGAVGDAMYFIAKGEIVIYNPGTADDTELNLDGLRDMKPQQQNSDGASLLSVERDGGYFGERALLFTAPRAASAAARKFSELLRLPREDFNEVLQQHPAFDAELRRRVARRQFNYRGMMSQFSGFSLGG